MRISLSQEASQAFETIVKAINDANPFIERDNASFLSAVVITFEQALGNRQIEELVQMLSTPESRRRALIHQVEQLSLGMDAQAIRSLEASIKKLNKKGGESENEQPKQ